jgi:hypothetical protein
MARAPGDNHSASLGQTTMTHTIQCPKCGVVLNVPASAAGRKLKCPKCATKFSTPALGPADSVIADAGPASSMFPTRKGSPSSGDIDLPGPASSSGSIELPTSKPKRPASSGAVGSPKSKPKRPASSGAIESPTSKPKRPPSGVDFDLPTTSSAPLRETFDLPLLGEDLPNISQAKKPSAAPDDALALFQDEPKTNRKPKGAEARAKIRRCPSCGGVVGVGMSLCNTCGLDLDTGQRVAPLDVFDDEMPAAPRDETPPLGVLFVGSFAALINLLLSVASLVAYAKGDGTGMLCLMVIWIFGIYASVQFLRRKTIRPLFLALGLGAAIGTVYLIALPIWEVNVGTDNVEVKPGVIRPAGDPADPDAPLVHNIAEDLDMKRITWGIIMLLGYAGLSVYLNTPSVKREFTKR